MMRPLSTVDTMLAKLSSVRIISLASFATSVPVIPMAIPMSAFLRAGASFTPSPVMATMWPLVLRALRILTLWRGLTRAKIRTFSTRRRSSSSVMCSSSWPVSTSSPRRKSPICFPMALAVRAWSPVIIITSMWAEWQRLMASLTSGRAGSIMAARPMKIIFSSFSLLVRPALTADFCSLYANPSTR